MKSVGMKNRSQFLGFNDPAAHTPFPCYPCYRLALVPGFTEVLLSLMRFLLR